MTEGDKKSPGNVIDLAKERKKHRTLKRKGASRSEHSNRPSTFMEKWGRYLQLGVFLVLIWYMMKTCGG